MKGPGGMIAEEAGRMVKIIESIVRYIIVDNFPGTSYNWALGYPKLSLSAQDVVCRAVPILWYSHEPENWSLGMLRLQCFFYPQDQATSCSSDAKYGVVKGRLL